MRRALPLVAFFTAVHDSNTGRLKDDLTPGPLNSMLGSRSRVIQTKYLIVTRIRPLQTLAELRYFFGALSAVR